MPSVKTPDGRTLRFPEGTSDEQVMEVLRTQFPDQFQAPEPPTPAATPAPAAPTPPPPARAAPDAPRAPRSGGGGDPPTLAAPEPARAVPEPVPATLTPAPAPSPVKKNLLWSLGLPDIQYSQETKDNVQNALAGAGQSAVSTIRGARQLWNMATGDTEELARLNADEEEARRLDAPLLATKAGRAGQVAGYLAQFALPGGVAAKGATKLAPVLGMTGRALPAVMAAEGVTGGVAGATMPTTGDESHLHNAEVGAALGAALPGVQRYAGPIVRGVGKAADVAKWLVPAPYGVVRATELATKAGSKAITSYLDKGKAAAAQAAEQAFEATKAEGRKMVSDITSSVKIPKASMEKALRRYADDFGDELPGYFKKRVSQMLGEPERAAAEAKAAVPKAQKPVKNPDGSTTLWRRPEPTATPAPAPKPTRAPRRQPITGEHINDTLDMIEQVLPDTKGVQKKALTKLQDLLETHVGQNLSEADRARLIAARSRALHGAAPTPPPVNIRYSPGRQAVRTVIQQ